MQIIEELCVYTVKYSFSRCCLKATVAQIYIFGVEIIPITLVNTAFMTFYHKYKIHIKPYYCSVERTHICAITLSPNITKCLYQNAAKRIYYQIEI